MCAFSEQHFFPIAHIFFRGFATYVVVTVYIIRDFSRDSGDTTASPSDGNIFQYENAMSVENIPLYFILD